MCRTRWQKARKHTGWKPPEMSFIIKAAIDGMAFTGDPATQKESPANVQGQTMLNALFNNDGIIHKEFVPAGQTVNAAFYVHILKWLLQCICHVQPDLPRTGTWMLLHNNVPAHCAIRVH
ncbi:hypothetical protein PR048_032334 [Dryococelus australis]|uniref:Transposase n=1 Tax=Dryococelus australis TaxID=614101 RepID=A0ABQ9G640_9NEOP|nr:hypothetical protein PR048_032334 [Dryococelus australis]